MSGPRILHVAASDSAGGAARAAYRIHEALVNAGVDSRMRVIHKGTDDPHVTTGPRRSIWGGRMHRAAVELQRRWSKRRQRSWRPGDEGFYTVGTVSEGLVDELNTCDADVLNLHWISGALSISDIGRLTKPIVWTLHDMWPFCGAEHYAPDESDARFRVGYRADNQPRDERGPDLSRHAWEAKRGAWAHQRFTIVGPSRWMADRARASVLFARAKVVTVPYPLNTTFPWRPIDRTSARDILGLPQDRKLILAGAMGGVRDPRKGGDLLLQAVGSIAAHDRDFDVAIFGQGRPSAGQEWPCRVHWLGAVNDDRTMALAYSAADVMAVPSRQDNLCQTATEAQACGVPVVAFDIGGMPDIVEDGRTGRLVPPFDTTAYAEALRWGVQASGKEGHVGGAARAAAVSRWHPDVVVPQYLAVYEKAIACRSAGTMQGP